MYQPRDYQQAAIASVTAWLTKSVEPCLVEAATGCHEKGHPIRMYSGEVKPVESVQVGDLIMSPYGESRTVVRLHTGSDTMFRLTPKKGESFTVNGGHILSLYTTPRSKGQKHEFVEMTVYEYLKQNKTFKHRAKLWRGTWEKEKRQLPISPWALGALIGDGCLTGLTPSFCTPDKEVLDGLISEADCFNCEIRKVAGDRSAPTYTIFDKRANRSTKNRFRQVLEYMGVYFKSAAEKFIPEPYFTSSREQKLELIAGLIDTDGHLTKSGYDWISKSEQLADDLLCLCRSVGLAAYKTKCTKGIKSYGFKGTYYRVSISGECSAIPCRVSRKVASTRQQIKRVDVTGFTVEKMPRGEYFGFELDGDRLYQDGFGYIHHNSGKSIIVAKIADYVHVNSHKKVLCLAPSSELTEQNHEKYVSYDLKASIYSASIEKSLRHPVIFGTPKSVLNNINAFGDVAAVIIDEAHVLTPTIKSIVSRLMEVNTNLRVIGLSATPYRLSDGFIYAYDENGNPVPEEETVEPYFHSLVYRITAPYLIEQGYLTQPHADPNHAASYDTTGISRHTQSEYEEVFEGHGRKTAEIIADIVSHSHYRMGVMIFAATIRHAEECLASLPPDNSRIITGTIKKSERKEIINDFKARKFKYLVNVAVLTTGFDAPHVDVVAVLRATESASLFQQIIGRGLRLHPDKRDCLVLDYAENIERHELEDDLFAPKITARKKRKGLPLEVICPLCRTTNEFSMRPNPDELPFDSEGYFVDLTGERILVDEQPLPAHFGRRCFGFSIVSGKSVRCEHRWSVKECHECCHENDIAARFCESCKEELIDPNARLVVEFKRLKADRTKPSTDKVTGFSMQKFSGKSNRLMIKASYQTEYANFDVWYNPESADSRIRGAYEKFSKAYFSGRVAPNTDMFFQYMDRGTPPSTVTYIKPKGSKYYEAIDYNQPEDKAPE